MALVRTSRVMESRTPGCMVPDLALRLLFHPGVDPLAGLIAPPGEIDLGQLGTVVITGEGQESRQEVEDLLAPEPVGHAQPIARLLTFDVPVPTQVSEGGMELLLGQAEAEHLRHLLGRCPRAGRSPEPPRSPGVMADGCSS